VHSTPNTKETSDALRRVTANEYTIHLDDFSVHFGNEAGVWKGAGMPKSWGIMEEGRERCLIIAVS